MEIHLIETQNIYFPARTQKESEIFQLSSQKGRNIPHQILAIRIHRMIKLPETIRPWSLHGCGS